MWCCAEAALEASDVDGTAALQVTPALPHEEAAPGLEASAPESEQQARPEADGDQGGERKGEQGAGPAQEAHSQSPAAVPTAAAEAAGQPAGAQCEQRRVVVAKSMVGTIITLLAQVNSEDLEPRVANLISFGAQRELLRASRISRVMQRGAAILAHPGGDAATYALSKAVEKIEIFISHNWAVSRATKFMCMVLHFNFRLAIAAAVAALGIMALAASRGVRLVVMESPVASVPAMGKFEHGLGCTLVVTPVFVLTACFGHELKRLAGYHGCTVFLDKTCIHQVDKGLQREGISKLGAFLASSSHMMVLYTDLYLSKLWTVYEVACFLALHPAGRLIVIPQQQPKIVVGVVVCLYVRMLLELFVISVGGPVLLVSWSFQTLMFFGLMMLFRRWEQAKEAIHQRMATFEVEDCICAQAEDRPLVFGNIALLMRAVDAVDSDATEQDALNAFNILLRKCLPQTLAASHRTLGLQYHQVVGLWFCTSVARAFDQEVLGVFYHPEEEWVTRYRFGQFGLRATWTFGFYPITVAVLAMMAGCCLKVRGFWEWALMTIPILALAPILATAQVIMRTLVLMSVVGGPRRNLCAGMLLVIFISALSLAIFIYSRRPRLQAAEETEADAEEEEEAAAAEQIQ